MLQHLGPVVKNAQQCRDILDNEKNRLFSDSDDFSIELEDIQEFRNNNASQNLAELAAVSNLQPDLKISNLAKEQQSQEKDKEEILQRHKETGGGGNQMRESMGQVTNPCLYNLDRTNKVLVVQDDMINGQAIQLLLSQLKVNSDIARNKMEASKMIQQRYQQNSACYKLIIFDIGYKLKRGLEILKSIVDLVDKQ